MKYFKLYEFDSPDQPGSGKNMQASTLDLLDQCREVAGIPFIITSGHRTASHNQKVGGTENSSHLRGYAVDVECNNSKDRYKIVQSALSVGFNRIGISGSFIHLDNDPAKTPNVIWTY
ncbi:D-Ala-D-Ala carboxypeptidase family metallohydrolase [Pseudotenacibaculum haliotis]|uniref:D-Ala-D-Ala carboxypeptidase family metallohydrolase n=1 Tax=Pseudotenacibaculum haliotis TaxID=1862138 RepID=A0ABW5LQ48_9FLAO